MIVDGNEGGHFEVESVPRANGASKGTIVVNKPLDYEHGEKNFKLKIRAYNKDATNADAHKYQVCYFVMLIQKTLNLSAYIVVFDKSRIWIKAKYS